MMNNADGMLGAIMASESLGLTDTMINGAGGCRSRSQIMLHDLIPRYYPENSGCCRSKYFSRQSRLPCTYLNGDDIIHGSAVKVLKGIESASSITGRRVTLLDTLGASLICTDYSGLTGTESYDPIIIEDDLSAMTMAEGYDSTMSTLLGSMDADSDGEDGFVNILGYGIMDQGWETGADHLCHLLELMDLKVNCMPGCIPDKESLKAIGRSGLNIMIHPEYSIQTARMLRERFGTDHIRLTEGAPIGYDATRAFVTEVAERMDADPGPAMDFIDREAISVHQILMNYDKLPASLHAKGVALKGESSVVYPLLKWMTGSFGMIPRSVSTVDGEYSGEIKEYLEVLGLNGMESVTDGNVDVVFSDGMDALEGRMKPSITAHVGIMMPRSSAIDLMGRTLVGTIGCRYILDEVFNNMMRFRCGQPTDINYRPGYEE